MDASAKRILVVDDDARIRRRLTGFLIHKGCHPACAETGPLALALLPLFRPDMVLLDTGMPGMDGLEVLRRIRRDGSEAEVIMLAAANDRQLAHQAMQRGARNYLTKPFGAEQLERAWQSILCPGPGPATGGLSLTHRPMRRRAGWDSPEER